MSEAKPRILEYYANLYDLYKLTNKNNYPASLHRLCLKSLTERYEGVPPQLLIHMKEFPDQEDQNKTNLN